MKKLLILSAVILTSCGGNSYYEGVAIPVKSSSRGDYGFVNLDGEVIVDFQIDERPSIMVENWAYYTFEDQIVYVNSAGDETSTTHQESLSFSEGHALVRLENGKLGLLDKTLSLVQVLEGVEEAGSLSEGLIKIRNNDGLWGFHNLKNQEVIKPIYSEVQSFSEGKAVVEKYDEEADITRIGVINSQGEEVIALSSKYDDIGPFHDGLSVFEQDDQMGYLDEQGNEVISSDNWKKALPFSDGTATVLGNDNEFGLIDKKGEFLIRTRESFPIKFFNDLAVYKGTNRKFGYMDIQRQPTTRAEFEDVLPFFRSGAFAKDGGEWMYIDKEGNDKTAFNVGIKSMYHEEFTESVYTNNTAFDLNETLESRFIDIEGFYGDILDPFSGFLNQFKGNNVVSVEALEGLAVDQGSDINVLQDNSLYSSRIDTYSILNEHMAFDQNIKFSLRFYLSEPPVKMQDSDRALNANAKLRSIRVNLRLQEKGYGRGREMLGKIYDAMKKSLDTDDSDKFVTSDGTKISLSSEYSNVYIVFDYPQE